jgi:SRSO17 transposase
MRWDRVKRRNENEVTESELKRWGLSSEAIGDLGNRLEQFWRYYGQWTRTQTRDTSVYGLSYVSGLLRMRDSRTMTHIAREGQVAEQNMQHFMSNSPWSGRGLIGQVQQAIVERGELQGGMLILDESADEKSGESSAGAGRQHNGRMGKIDEAQVGVYLAYAKDQHWTLWDSCLFVPEKWFSASAAARRAKAGIPNEQTFQTKVELGWEMIERAQATGLSFAAVAFDSLYGRSHWLRACCEEAALEYYADIPNNYPLYRDTPVLEFEQGKRGTPTQKLSVVGQVALKASDFARLSQTVWENISLRPTERGRMQVEFARFPVWTVNTTGIVREETLLLKREGQTIRYTLTNAPRTTPLATLAARKCQRYFIERSLQDAKSELGMADFQALKYRAWEHHFALTLVASWFIAQTRLDWAEELPPDSQLLCDYATDNLPQLSMANVCELLRAALPLRQLSTQQAAALVIQHLDNRTRSRRSRLRNRSAP